MTQRAQIAAMTLGLNEGEMGLSSDQKGNSGNVSTDQMMSLGAGA